MTKAELVDKIARDAGITKTAAKKAANLALDFKVGVRDSLKAGKKVTLVGFRTYASAKMPKKAKATRTGRFRVNKVHIVAPSSASEIRASLGITRADHKAALRALVE